MDNIQSSIEFDQLKAIMSAVDQTKNHKDNCHDLKAILDSEKGRILQGDKVTYSFTEKIPLMIRPPEARYLSEVVCPALAIQWLFSAPNSS